MVKRWAKELQYSFKDSIVSPNSRLFNSNNWLIVLAGNKYTKSNIAFQPDMQAWIPVTQLH